MEAIKHNRGKTPETRSEDNTRPAGTSASNRAVQGGTHRECPFCGYDLITDDDKEMYKQLVDQPSQQGDVGAYFCMAILFGIIAFAGLLTFYLGAIKGRF